MRPAGEPPPPVAGASGAWLRGRAYLAGGGRLHRLGLPRDLCGLFSHSRLGCLRSVGCSFCSAQDGANVSHCYSSARPTPPR